MSKKRRDDEDTIEALELLRATAPDSEPPPPAPPPGPEATSEVKPIPKPSPPTDRPPADRPPADSSPADSPPADSPAEERSADSASSSVFPVVPPSSSAKPLAWTWQRASFGRPRRVQRYRCLHCGYSLAGAVRLRCSECGRSYDDKTLVYWFSGDEQARFKHVVWLVIVGLLLRVLVLPELLLASRLASAIVIGLACHLALEGRRQSKGEYYATGGMVAAGLMLLVFSWQKSLLPFYLLDITAGGLLLLAMLRGPAGGNVGAVTVNTWRAPVILLVTPFFGTACYVLHSFGGDVLPANAPLSRLFQLYPPFDFMLPCLAAAAVWLLVWRTLAGIRKMLFGQEDL